MILFNNERCWDVHSHLLRLALLLTPFVLCSCQTHRPWATTPSGPVGSTVSEKKSFDLPTRNNSLALLNDLLNDEKNLSKILIIKLESAELDRVVKDISATAANGAKLLESVTKNNPQLNVEKTELPPGEQAVRDSIAKTKRKLLLHSHGAEFQFQILLTQVQALSYGAHLALIISENEPDTAIARQFSDLSARLSQLQERALAMLRK